MNAASAPIDKGTGVTGIVENLGDTRMLECTPEHVALADATPDTTRKLPAFTMETTDNRTCRGDFTKGVEHQLHAATDLLVRVDLDDAIRAIHQADGQRHF